MATLLVSALIVGVALLIRWLILTQPPEPALPQLFSAMEPALALEQDADLSPRGDARVYVAPGPQGGLDLFLSRGDGEPATLLTPGWPGDERGPDFSPDGARIVFSSDRDGGGLFVMNVEEGGLARLASFGEDPDWSPDGTRIVFADGKAPAEGVPSPLPALWVVDAAGGRPLRILDHGFEPAWAPGEERIAFARFRGAATSARIEIATVRPDGTDPTFPEEFGGDGRFPRWSPDGRHLYFWSSRGGEPRVWRVLVDELSGRVLGDASPAG